MSFLLRMFPSATDEDAWNRVASPSYQEEPNEEVQACVKPPRYLQQMFLGMSNLKKVLRQVQDMLERSFFSTGNALGS